MMGLFAHGAPRSYRVTRHQPAGTSLFRETPPAQPADRRIARALRSDPALAAIVVVLALILGGI